MAAVPRVGVAAVAPVISLRWPAAFLRERHLVVSGQSPSFCTTYISLTSRYRYFAYSQWLTASAFSHWANSDLPVVTGLGLAEVSGERLRVQVR